MHDKSLELILKSRASLTTTQHVHACSRTILIRIDMCTRVLTLDLVNVSLGSCLIWSLYIRKIHIDLIISFKT